MLIAPTEITYVISDKYSWLPMEDNVYEEEYHFCEQTFSNIENCLTHPQSKQDERHWKSSLPFFRESVVTHPVS